MKNDHLSRHEAALLEQLRNNVKRQLAAEEEPADNDIYTDDGLDTAFDDDLLTAAQYGFMRGWHAAD